MKLLTPQQMAEILRISPKTLSRWCAKYALPYYGKGRTKRFDEGEVLAHLKAQRHIESPVYVAPKRKFKITEEKSPDRSYYEKLLGWSGSV